MIARPKKAAKEMAQCYGEFFGVTSVVTLLQEQKWNVRKSSGYYFLSRKGGAQLRLTEAALSRLFDLEDDAK